MKNRSLYLASILAVLALFQATVLAQQPAEPGPEHAFLKGHAGTWDAVLKTGPEETKCLMVCKSVAGKPAKYKAVTEYPDADHQIFNMFMLGADGNETHMMTIEYTRRK